ncbi:MAG: aconitate hydratase, partial [Gammaproteobacteria bacterium]|jgi:aconitate hydratase
VIAKGFSRIHWQNLCNFGILPLRFADPDDYDRIDQGDELVLKGLRDALGQSSEVTLENTSKKESYKVVHDLSPRQVDMVLKGSLLTLVREKQAA